MDIASEIKDLSDDEVFQMDYDIILGNANASQITINEYLNTIVKHGPQETTQKSLNPGTEYAVWAYGLGLQEDGTLVRLSKITREYFTTEIPTALPSRLSLPHIKTTNTTILTGTMKAPLLMPVIRTGQLPKDVSNSNLTI